MGFRGDGDILVLLNKNDEYMDILLFFFKMHIHTCIHILLYM